MLNKTYFTKHELELYHKYNSVFNEDQMKIINRKTPSAEVEQKFDKDNIPYKSVKAPYLKALLNLITGGNYSFEIKTKELIQASREVVVEGRLTLNINNKTVMREQFGQHYLGTKTQDEGNARVTRPSDVGNSYKAAATDAFKKCCSELGLCWDIYGQEREEAKKTSTSELSYEDRKNLEQLTHFLEKAQTPLQVEECYTQFLKSSKETKETKELYDAHIERTFSEKI